MIKRHHIAVSLFLTILTTSCIWDINDDNDIVDPPFESAYEAVIISREAFETSTELLATKPLEATGKIYVKDDYLLINEPNKGFHVYDNSDPTNPVKIKFLKVLGSTDISIKDNVLYINNAVDLIAVTFNADFSSIQITKRVRDVFPLMLSPDRFYPNPSDNEVVVDWELIN